jgi:dihydrodipicolinate synthase/N-acetylneuraminate lyase
MTGSLSATGPEPGPATGPASTGPASTGPASTGPASTGPASTGPALRGTWGTVLLPIRPDQRIDFELLASELDALVKVGLAGVYTCGTAGEFHTLDEDEFDQLSQLVAEKCKQAAVAFQIGASHMSGQISLSRIGRARWLTPVAIQAVLPDWLPLSPEEVHRAVEKMVAVADPVPIVLYNPRHAKTVCSAQQLAALANELPGLVAVKVSGDDAFYLDLHAAAPRLSIFAPGHELARARHLGAVGSYSNVACLEPSGALSWERQMDEDPVAADALGERILAFFARHILPLRSSGYSDTALDKTLAAIGGWAPIGTRVRWPYSSVPEEVIDELAPVARAALPELF